MTGEIPPPGVDLRTKMAFRARDRAFAAVQLMAAVVLFIVLAGIWACLWVPPSWGW